MTENEKDNAEPIETNLSEVITERVARDEAALPDDKDQVQNATGFPRQKEGAAGTKD